MAEDAIELRAATYCLDLRAEQLLRDGEPVDLTGKPLQVLRELMTHPGRLVTKTALMEAVWDGRPLSDATLTTAMRTVRRALGDDARDPFAIATVHGRGYRFLLPVEVVRAPPRSEPAPAGPPPTASRPRRSPRAARFTAGAIAAGFVVAVLLLFWSWRGPTDGSEAPGAAAGAVPSVAVLPFDDLSPDGSEAWFAEGLTEELLHGLAALDGLRVAARTSSSRFRDQDADVRRIGRALDVSHVIEGSVRTSGDRLRITAQLIRTDDGFHEWSMTYDRPLGDLDALAVQREVSRRIAQRLAPDAVLEDPVSAGVTPAAYEAYRRGRVLAERRSGEGLREGIRTLERAVEAAPDFPEARAALANALLLGISHGLVDGIEGMARAHAQVDAAMRRAPESPEVLTAATLLAIADGDLDTARERAQAAVDFGPRYLPALQRLGVVQMLQGDPESAFATLERARNIDPLSAIVLANLADAALHTGRVESALETARQNARWNPNEAPARAQLGTLLLWLGRYEESHEHLAAAVALSGAHPLGVGRTAELYWRIGAHERTLRLATDPDPSWNARAARLLQLGERDRALSLADRNAQNVLIGISALDIRQWAGADVSLGPAIEAWFNQRSAYDQHGIIADDAVAVLAHLEQTGDPRAVALRRHVEGCVARMEPGPSRLAWEYYAAAAWHAYEGRDDQALAWLGHAADAGHVFPEIELDPLFEALRGSAAFDGILARMESRAAAVRAAIGAEDSSGSGRWAGR
jgi:TolB-like protein/DNA-binding winged helix-turn-helix (wHTH) protein